MTSKPRGPYSFRRELSSGISRRQGGHQVAQKLISSGWPSHSLIDRLTPFESTSENSGRVSGMALAVAGALAGVPAGAAGPWLPAGARWRLAR